MIARRLAVVLLLAASSVFAADAGRVLREAPMRDGPYSDAAETTTLAADTEVAVLERRGGWYRVQAGGHGEGWVRMTALRLGKPQQGGDSGAGSLLQFLSTGRSGSSGVTVATGIRGLDAADMTNAEPDHEAVERLAEYRAESDEARRFAREVALSRIDLAYFGPYEEPAEAGTDDSTGGGILGEQW